MDQVRFELTTSRVVSEVTLPFTTSNFDAQREVRILYNPPPRREPPIGGGSRRPKPKPGGKSSRVAG